MTLFDPWCAGSPQAEAVFGPLIVKQSAARDPHRHLYDEDVHVFTVSVFGSATLVNGRDVHEVSENILKQHTVKNVMSNQPKFVALTLLKRMIQQIFYEITP